MTDNVEQNVEEQGQEAVLFTFTNDKNEYNMNMLKGLLKMVYHTVLTNRLGIMQAKNSETGELEVIMVGVEQNGDALNCYPLFSPIRAEDVAKFLAPNGAGGYLGEDKAE